MKNYFERVKTYLIDLEYPLTYQNQEEGILVINKELDGFKNLIIGVTDSIIIIEQFLFRLKQDDKEIFKQLLIKNRDIVHGAFVLDESGTKVIFRDTLQVENLDLNELEGTLNSLSLLLSEYASQLVQFSKH